MVCVYCGSSTEVTNSRRQKRSNSVWRRRKCQACNAIITSIESVDLDLAILYDNGTKKAPFVKEKLFISIYDSCRHRPTALQDAINLSATVISSCLAKQSNPGVITRNDLVTTTLLCLQRFDKAAGTYYAAYHPLKAT